MNLIHPRFFFATLAALTLLALTASPARAQQYQWTNFVGQPGGTGNADGTGSDARFYNPSGLAADSAGNLFLADTQSNTIRKVTAAGVVTTLAGLAGSGGSADGTGSAARFYQPIGMAVDSSGNLYVTDNFTTLRKVTPAGVVTTLAGSAGNSGSADGTGAAARFSNPTALAVDGAGNIYVGDSDNHTLRKVTGAGVVTTLAGSVGVSGSADGTGNAATFSYLAGLTVDSSGNVYVADHLNHTIRKVTPAGVVTTLAGSAGNSGVVDETGSAARFFNPSGVVVDGAGDVYVTDSNGQAIRKVTSAGVVTTLAGTPYTSGSADGTGAGARFYSPWAVTLYAGDLYVAELGNSTIRKVTPAGGVTTLAGLANSFGNANGTGSGARLYGPSGVAVDGSGNVYVADTNNSAIRKVTPAGVVTTLAGLPGNSGAADGTGNAARFSFPTGVTVNGSGNVYVADSGNSTIRRVTPAGLVTTLAGLAGSDGSADGTGSAARFSYPTGVAVDGSGNVYVADQNNQTIRKVTPVGVVTTLAGLAGSPGYADGTGSAARFFNPTGVAVDGSGNVYVADRSNRNIRKVTPGGVVTTLAGPANHASGSADGTGSAARFNRPVGVAVDGSGNVYVADVSNNNIRKVNPAGVVTTIGGTAGVTGGADGVGGAAQFSSPQGITVSSNGTLFVADSNNNRITTGIPSPTPILAVEQPAGTSIASNGTQSIAAVQGSTASVTFIIRNSGTADLTGLTITKDGTNAADFSVTIDPTAPVVPSGITAFVIQFTASQTSDESAAIHIASNDTTNNPFNINLTGVTVYSQAQSAANRIAGQNDVISSPITYGLYTASQYAANGTASRTAGQNDVLNSPNTYSLYSLTQVQALNADTPLITKEAGTGQFKLTLSLKKSADLVNFSSFPIVAPQTTVNAQGEIEFLFTVPDNAAFFRVGAH